MIRKTIKVDDNVSYEVGYIPLNAQQHIDLLERGADYAKVTQKYELKKLAVASGKDYSAVADVDVDEFVAEYRKYNLFVIQTVADLVKEVKIGSETVKVGGLQDIPAKVVEELMKQIVPKGR